MSDTTESARPLGLGSNDQLGPLPLWFDDGGRAWLGADELTREALYAWRDAAVAADRTRWTPVVAAMAADLRACAPTLLENGMDTTAHEFLLAADELSALIGGPNVRREPDTTAGKDQDGSH